MLIAPVESSDGAGEALRLHLPHKVKDFDGLEEAVAHARREMLPWMENLGQQVGAAQVEVQMTRQDRIVPVRAGWEDQVFLGTELIFSAVGRPSLAAPTASEENIQPGP